MLRAERTPGDVAPGHRPVLCRRVTPGTTTWIDAAPVVLVAVGLLFVPGVVAGKLLRLPWAAAIGAGPALSTTLLVGGGVLCGALGVRWAAATVVAVVAVGWVLAAGVGLAMPRSRGVSPADPPETESATSPGWLAPAAWVGGLAFALAAVAVVLTKVTGTPDHFPQHPDTIFHLGDALSMVQRRDVSLLHASQFMGAGHGVYPAAFHVVTATTSLLSGANIVVATQSAVLVMGGLAWPAGAMLLAQALLGRRPEVVGVTAPASVLFTAFPFTVMGFGVLWPNLFGQALLPGVMATSLAALARWVPHRAPVATPVPAALATLAAVPGLTLAHPNALVTLLVLGYFVVAGAMLHSAWVTRGRPRAAALRLAGLALVTVAAAAASVVLRNPSMVKTGAPGPEKSLRGALVDTVFFGPRHAPQLYLLTLVAVVGGVALLWRHRGTGWVPWSAAFFAALYLVNVAVDNHAARYFTWPWYNNAIRLAVAGSLPAVLCATAGFLAIGSWLARPFRRVVNAPLYATGLVIGVFLALTFGYTHAHRVFLEPYYHPDRAHSWASDQELRALRTLSSHIPQGAVTAANAWNGGTYLYIVSGKPLLVPTEKALFPGDRILLAAQLDRAGASPQVCAAARRQHVEYAIVGGQPFAWAGRDRVALYAGIDRVATSPAFTLVASAAPYRLYRLATCAGG